MLHQETYRKPPGARRPSALGSRFAAWQLALLSTSLLLISFFSLSAKAQSSSPPAKYRSHALPISKFYQTEASLPAGKPGQLIRSELTDDYELPEGIAAKRILYYSQAADGHEVPASAVVLFPENRTQPGSVPVLAWAHSFSGVARGCAPSLQRNLLNGPYLTMYAKLGYAVVAVDYAGLGTNVRNAGIDIPSNANDLVNAMSAARAAVPQLGTRWIAVGDSMGGAAVVKVAEMDPSTTKGLLGTISVGDIAQVDPAWIVKTPLSSALFAYSLKAVYSDASIPDMLTKAGVDLYSRVEKSCNPGDLPADKSVLQPNWQSKKNIKAFVDRNQLAQTKALVPLLVLGYEGAGSEGTSRTVDALCKRGDRVEYIQYAVNEGTLLGSTVRDQMAWIQDRFAGRTAPSTCP